MHKACKLLLAILKSINLNPKSIRYLFQSVFPHHPKINNGSLYKEYFI